MLVAIPGVVSDTVYFMMTPFLEDSVGGAQVTETVVAEERDTTTSLGAALGARKIIIVIYYSYI